MRTQEIHNFGNIYTLSLTEIENFAELHPLFEEEEEYALSLIKVYNLEVREDLLILFVQMYLLRFAIPYFQIMYKRFPDKENILFLRRILYFCMVGRCIDDLIDDDSNMFKKYESILLYRKYAEKLQAIQTEEETRNFHQYLFDSTKYKSPTLLAELPFSALKSDIYERIKYFFCQIEREKPTEVDTLAQYVTILLAGLDLNDAIADGYQRGSSTSMSNYIYKRYYNDERKLLLDNSLISFYQQIRNLLREEATQLIHNLSRDNLFYTINILKRLFEL